MIYNGVNRSCTKTVYRLLLDWTTDTFWKYSERKGCSKISKIPKKFLCHRPFFTNGTACRVQNFRLQQTHIPRKCFLWVFWKSWKFAREKSIMKSFDYLNASKNISSQFFVRILEKLLLWKYWNIIQKTSLVALLLQNSRCLIHPPITIEKTNSTAGGFFVSSENFQNCRESVCGGITFQ